MNNIQINRNNEGLLEATASFPTSLIEDHHEIAENLFNKIETALNQRINALLYELYSEKVNQNDFILLGYSNSFWERSGKKPLKSLSNSCVIVPRKVAKIRAFGRQSQNII